ncbi:hypothetical protein D6D10_06289 [Aureobasidium pullulans]|uniref:Uncharacterized protein n=1 Tax=Aureobasidium pullulans TaxID=5580 RepID=A0A4S9ET14_AURPU|nr:hypothetical protein D6D10_06289 [Aureobasidium pullulans]
MSTTIRSRLYSAMVPYWREAALTSGILLATRIMGTPNISGLMELARSPSARVFITLVGLPILLLVELLKKISGLLNRSPISTSTLGIDGTAFADEAEMTGILSRLGNSGPRTTGSQIHNELIDWLEQELRSIPGISVKSHEYEILRWQTVGGRALNDAGKLTLLTGTGDVDIAIAGAVPFSLPTGGRQGSLLYVPRGTALSSVDIRAKIVLRDFPAHPVPYSMVFLPSYFKTADLIGDLLTSYDRPGLADMPLKEELIAAGKAGAAGMVIMFDVEREYVQSYFEPHQGVHYRLPAVFVGAKEAALLRDQATRDAVVSISVTGETQIATTRNLSATLKGQVEERVIYQSHTDGNTFVQENGPVALLSLCKYFANQPLRSRRRTLEFAFNTGHLHISREGTAMHAEQIQKDYDDGKLALIIPMEHLGAREIERGPRSGQLSFTGRGELMFWSVGPSPVVLQAVREAVVRRKLDRVLITRGTSMPDFAQVPTYSSFGGIGTYYHNALLPTTSLISGPWSLWAPWFGEQAVDVGRLRAQTLALGDLYLALDNVPRSSIIAGYEAYREKRRKGAKVPGTLVPDELA